MQLWSEIVDRPLATGDTSSKSSRSDRFNSLAQISTESSKGNRRDFNIIAGKLERDQNYDIWSQVIDQRKGADERHHRGTTYNHDTNLGSGVELTSPSSNKY